MTRGPTKSIGVHPRQSFFITTCDKVQHKEEATAHITQGGTAQHVPGEWNLIVAPNSWKVEKL